MKLSGASLIAFLPLLAACAAETETEPSDVAVKPSTKTDAVVSGTHISCHFLAAGCAGEGPDGFSQEPQTSGAGGGGGGYAATPVDPGGAGAYVRCTNACTSSSYTQQSYASCQQTCLASGAAHVIHLPGVGFVPNGPPSSDGYPSCSSDCASLENSCIASCATGGVF